MKRSFILILTLLTLTIFAFSEVKIGVINSQELLQKTKKGSQTLKKLEDLKNAKERQIQTLVTELETLEKELSSPALNANTQKEMQSQSAKMLGDLEKEFIPIINQVGQAKGYTLVLDVANSGVAYFAPTADITAEMIKAVDEKLPVK
jgi:Skp family chaperone for outer membrane proteins